jgi:hypothetical protein
VPLLNSVFHQEAGLHSERVFLRDTNNLILWRFNDLICLKIQLHANLDIPNIQIAIVRPECSRPLFLCVCCCCQNFAASVSTSWTVFRLTLAFWLSDCLISFLDCSVFFCQTLRLHGFCFWILPSTPVATSWPRPLFPLLCKLPELPRHCTCYHFLWFFAYIAHWMQ